MRIAALAAAAALVCSAAPAAAQTPDFSGTWRLDRDASEFLTARRPLPHRRRTP